MAEINRSVGNSQLKTLQDFINFYKFLGADGKAMTTTELLNYKSERLNITNRQSIRNSYQLFELKGVQVPEAGKEADLIFPQTQLAIPDYAYQRDFIRVETNAIQDYKDIRERNKRVFRSSFERLIAYKYNGLENRYKKTYNRIRVWVWCRALGTFPDGQLIDVSAFVKSISTNVAQNGGNFSITLGAVMGIFENGKITPIFSRFQKSDTSIGLNQVLVKSSTLKPNTDGTKRNLFYFHHVIKPNDIVFISYNNDSNDIFENDDSGEKNDLEVDINLLAHTVPIGNTGLLNPEEGALLNNLGERATGNTSDKKERRWDMIGLVDSNTQSFSASPSLSVTVTGRDLMKVLIDDQEKFFPLEYAGVDIYGMFNNLKNDTIKKNRAQRRLDGELSAINVFVDNTIEECLVFIFSQLSHVEIAPDSVFRSWGDSRSVYKYPTGVELVKQTGVDKTGKVVDTSFKRVKGFEEEIGAGIWAIIKIIVDDNEKDGANSLKVRRIVDSSIRTEQGSILNYVNRVCQPPFVEFWGDTIGNQYYLNVRRPPFYEIAFKDNLEFYDKLDEDSGNTFHIQELNIVSEDLTFNADEVYTWYRINPTGNFLGDSSTMVNAYLPAIFFPEYAEIYGARALEVTSNYIDYTGTLRGSNQSPSLNFLQQQAVNDLRFLVETNAYLPFTRKGSITVDLDVRYKKGMFVRHKGTDEVFYIDSVQHQYSVASNGMAQSSTVLTVSRGMVDKVQQDGIRTLDLYFKIIEYAENLNKTAKNYVLINWSVERTIFEYFMKGLQFSENLHPAMVDRLKTILFKPI
jgi:hypothetical protein